MPEIQLLSLRASENRPTSLWLTYCISGGPVSHLLCSILEMNTGYFLLWRIPHRTPKSGLHAIYCSCCLLRWLVGFLCWCYFCRLCPYSSQDAIFYIHLPWFLAFAFFAPGYVSDSASVSGYIVVYYLLFFWLYYHLQYQVSLLWSFSSGSQFKVNPVCNTNLSGNFWTF